MPDGGLPLHSMKGALAALAMGALLAAGMALDAGGWWRANVHDPHRDTCIGRGDGSAWTGFPPCSLKGAWE